MLCFHMLYFPQVSVVLVFITTTLHTYFESFFAFYINGLMAIILYWELLSPFHVMQEISCLKALTLIDLILCDEWNIFSTCQHILFVYLWFI
jgi:hypothetical protein